MNLNEVLKMKVTNMELFDNLQSIKEQLLDATPEVKTAFNNVVEYFSCKRETT